MKRVLPLALAVSALATLATVAWPQAAPPTPAVPEERLELPPPPFSDGIFPCSSCHADLKPNTTRRKLSEMHDDIELRHDEQHRWCLDCHDAADRDWLHLASGERVPFERSYLLCGQCHGEKLRDWRAGVHGRRTGMWNGQKSYLLCASCHNPHQPRFKPIAPKPAPRRPERPGGHTATAASAAPVAAPTAGAPPAASPTPVAAPVPSATAAAPGGPR